jgi:uncharacterized protein
MAGEHDLKVILSSLQPQLHEGAYVFAVLQNEAIPDGLLPVATMREDEGLTVVISQTEADAVGLRYDFVASWITLKVHSALTSVGLTAAFSTELANAGISCNVIAGYFHDQLFVPADQADQALEILRDLAGSFG